MRLRVTIHQDDRTHFIWSVTKFLSFLGGIIRAQRFSFTLYASNGTEISVTPIDKEP